MAKRTRVGSVKVDVKQVDSDGHAINFLLKLFPWATLANLDSSRGLCTSRDGKTYIRFEHTDNVKCVLSEIASSTKNRIKDNLTKILRKVNLKKADAKDVKIAVDLSQNFNVDEEKPAFVLFPGQYTSFAAYNIAKKNLKEFKSSNSLLNYADLKYRASLRVSAMNITVIEDDKGKITFLCAPYINVKRIVSCFKTGKEKQYDPEKVSEAFTKLAKKKEEAELAAYFAEESKDEVKEKKENAVNSEELEEVFSDDGVGGQEHKPKKSKKPETVEDRSDPEHVKFVEANFP